MKLVKTMLLSRLSEDTLDRTMRICIEGPEELIEGELEMILDHWKQTEILYEFVTLLYYVIRRYLTMESLKKIINHCSSK